MAKLYDPRCQDLATHFLGDETHPEDVASLAECIQHAVEGWFCLFEVEQSAATKDSNPSGFTAHRETGNLGASSSVPGRGTGSVEHREEGHGGETSANPGRVT